jgi:DNA polymerase-1
MRLRGAPRIARAIAERVQQILLMRRLTGIALDAPVPTAIDAYRPAAPDGDALADLVDRLRFGPLTRRACMEWQGAA